MKKANTVFTAMAVFAFVVSVIGGDWLALAQTPDNQNQATNANTQETGATQKTRSKSRRSGNKKAKADQAQTNTQDMANTSTNAAEAQPNQNTEKTSMGTTRRGRGRRRSTMSSAQSASTAEQTDLSGTYAGVLNCPDAGVTGDTTLTITGNQFSLADGKTGRVVAATTRGYTAVAMQFGEFTTTGQANAQVPATAPTVVSFRARKSGDRLVLSPVPGGRQCSFMPSGTTARSRRGRGNRRGGVTAPTGQETANPAETPPATQPVTPPPPPKTRRGARANQNRNANMNTNTNENMNSNENTGEGNANASPTPSPTPGPRRR